MDGLTGKQPVIVWFAYPRKGGWAFENRTYSLIKHLPNMIHKVIPPTKDLALINAFLDCADIIIVWGKSQYVNLSDRNKRKIIQFMPGDRMLQDIFNPIKRKKPVSSIDIAERLQTFGIVKDIIG